MIRQDIREQLEAIERLIDDSKEKLRKLPPIDSVLAADARTEEQLATKRGVLGKAIQQRLEDSKKDRQGSDPNQGPLLTKLDQHQAVVDELDVSWEQLELILKIMEDHRTELEADDFNLYTAVCTKLNEVYAKAIEEMKEATEKIGERTKQIWAAMSPQA